MKNIFFSCALLLMLAGCSSSARVGVGVPVGPFNVGVGVGSGGVSAGVGTGVGPVGVGVGVNPRGQVTGSAGVGASTHMGRARIGAGVGTSTILHDPSAAPTRAQEPDSMPQPQPQPQFIDAGQMQWRDAQGNIVPQCRVQGRC